MNQIKSRIWCYREFNDEVHKDREPVLYQLYMMDEEEVQWLAGDHEDRIYFFDSFDLGHNDVADADNTTTMYGAGFSIKDNKWGAKNDSSDVNEVNEYGTSKYLDSDKFIRESITVQGLENAITANQLSFAEPMAGHFVIQKEEGWMVKISGDGEVTLSEDYEPEAAAARFWNDLMRLSPRCHSRYDVPIVGVVECQLRGPHKGSPHYHSMTGRKSDRFWRWDEEEADQYLDAIGVEIGEEAGREAGREAGVWTITEEEIGQLSNIAMLTQWQIEEFREWLDSRK